MHSGKFQQVLQNKKFDFMHMSVVSNVRQHLMTRGMCWHYM